MEGKVEEKKSKTGLIIGIVIAAILIVPIVIAALAGLFVLAGITFLWAESFVEVEEETLLYTFDGELRTDGSNSALELTLIRGGEIDWSDYRVELDGTKISTAGQGPTSVGMTATFDVTLYGPFDIGSEYTVRIIDIADNKLIWTSSTICKSG